MTHHRAQAIQSLLWGSTAAKANENLHAWDCIDWGMGKTIHVVEGAEMDNKPGPG